MNKEKNENKKKSTTFGLLLLTIFVFALPLVAIGGIVFGVHLSLIWSIIGILIAFVSSILLIVFTVLAFKMRKFVKSQNKEEPKDDLEQEKIVEGIAKEELLVCPNCETVNSKETEFCTGCGLFLKIAYAIKK